MTIASIRNIVADLKHRFGNIGPEDMCDALGIIIKRLPMGRKSSDCKGFFMRQSRIRVIFLNSDLPRRIQMIILYHELGHAVLHGDRATECQFHDFALFDETSLYEYEANIFAAEYALPDEEVLVQLNDDRSFFNAARALDVPPELLDFKFRILKRLGYALNPPLYSQSNFLKTIGRQDRF